MTAPRAQEAFRQLVDTHYGFVCAITRRLAGPELDADDLAQEVFVVAHRKLSTLLDQTKQRSWLYGICRRVAARERRRLRARRTLGELFFRAPQSAAVSPEGAWARKELEGRLYRALDRLSPKLREALILFSLEEMEGGTIAELLGVPVNTVWSRLFAARKLLEHELSRDQSLCLCPHEEAAWNP